MSSKILTIDDVGMGLRRLHGEDHGWSLVLKGRD